MIHECQCQDMERGDLVEKIQLALKEINELLEKVRGEIVSREGYASIIEQPEITKSKKIIKELLKTLESEDNNG